MEEEGVFLVTVLKTNYTNVTEQFQKILIVVTSLTQNAVLFCTDSSAEHRNISVEPYQYCQRATQATGEVIFFSGRFNAVTKNCQLNHCLADLWDADSVEATDSFKQQCNTQTLHTTNQSDWIRFQNKICKYQQETCRNCHLPDDRLLGIVLSV